MSTIGKCVGSGGCSEVFEWGNEKVIKLYRSNTTRNAAEREFINSMAAWESGLPVPRPYKLVDMDGRPCVIFERITGETLKDRFFAQLYSSNNAKLPLSDNDKALLDHEDNDMRIIARLLYEVHKRSIPGVSTNQRNSLKHSISWPTYLTPGERQAVCEYLDSLPEMSCLCHGDPNPNNIIMRDGKPVIIDWMNATIGNPGADIAEFIIMFRYAILPVDTPSFIIDFFNAVRETIIAIFLDEYTKLSGMKHEDIDAWILPVAARKLSADAISEEEKSILVNVIRERLYKA